MTRDAQAANDPCSIEDVHERHIILAWETLAPDSAEWLEGTTMLGITWQHPDGLWLALSTSDLQLLGRAIDRGGLLFVMDILTEDAMARGQLTEDDAARAAGWLE